MDLPAEFVIPRPSRYKTLLSTRWGRGFAIAIRKLWWLGVAVLLADIFYCLLLRMRMRSTFLEFSEIVFLDSSKHSNGSILAYSELDEVVRSGSVILTSPTRVASTDLSSEVSILQLINFRELVNCVLMSLRAYGQLATVSNDPLFRLHLVRVWRGVITCVLMDKLNASDVGTLVHADHYDMNAVISHKFMRSIVLIQHGQVRSDIVPPCRIRPPSKLYVLDTLSEKIFRSCIFSDATAQIDVTPYLKKLVFVKTEYHGFVVLIASRPGDVEAEMQFISSLRLRGLDDVHVIVKPHPLMSKRMVYPNWFCTQQNVHVWLQRHCYPKPSVLVCGRSTMAIEFKAHNIPVLDVHLPNVVDAACELRTTMIRRKNCSGVSKESDD